MRVGTQHVVCGDVAMDMTWATFSPRITAAPLMAERRRLALRAETEGLQENWLQTADGTPSAWRIMSSNDPAFTIGVSLWVDGKPARPSLAMRTRMAISSLFGSRFSPMVVTVTPAVDWEKLTPSDRKEAEASVSAFLLQQHDLNGTIGTLSAQ